MTLVGLGVGAPQGGRRLERGEGGGQRGERERRGDKARWDGTIQRTRTRSSLGVPTDDLLSFALHSLDFPTHDHCNTTPIEQHTQTEESTTTCNPSSPDRHPGPPFRGASPPHLPYTVDPLARDAAPITPPLEPAEGVPEGCLHLQLVLLHHTYRDPQAGQRLCDPHHRKSWLPLFRQGGKWSGHCQIAGRM